MHIEILTASLYEKFFQSIDKRKHFSLIFTDVDGVFGVYSFDLKVVNLTAIDFIY